MKTPPLHFTNEARKALAEPHSRSIRRVDCSIFAQEASAKSSPTETASNLLGRSRTPCGAAINDSLTAGMLLIEGSRFSRLGLPSEVKVLMTVGGSLGGIGSTREVASPPTG